MKKVLIVVLSLLMVSTVLSVSVFAGDADQPTTLKIELGAVEAAPGSEVTVPIVITENPGIAGLCLFAEYSEQLTLIECRPAVDEMTLTVDRTMVWDAAADYSGVGTLAYLVFKVSDTAEATEKLTVSLKEVVGEYAINAAGTVIPIELTAGSVTVIEQHSAIKCAQVALGTDISVNFYADVIAADEGAQMRFTMNGKETLVDGELDEQSGLYVFPFTGITPQCMGDTIKAELVKDGEVLAVKDDYSVLQNCKNLIGKTAEQLGMTEKQYTAMKTLIADLMEYGAAAQTYRGYNTGSLMNTDEDIAELTPTTFTELVDSDDAPISAFLDPELSGDTDTKIVSAGVYFDYVNSLYVHFITPTVDTIYFSVTSEFYDDCEYTPEDYIQLEDGSYIFHLEPMDASLMSMSDGMNVEYTIAMKQKSGSRKPTVQTLNYSLAAYVYSKQGAETPMADLAKALYNYGLSAANYMAAFEK